MEPVDPVTARRFADAVAETPETFTAACAIRRSAARLWLVGPPESPQAAVVQAGWAPAEPMAFGSDPATIAEVLRHVPGWHCVNLAAGEAPALAAAIGRAFGLATELYGDVYYQPEGEVTEYRHPLVRRLDGSDVELLEAADPRLRPVGYGSTHAALEGGVVAGAVVGGALVSAIGMNASSDTYADIGGSTLDDWQGRGLATSAASLVARAVAERGLLPVWSTGESNRASRRVAEKLGFSEVGRAAYVIVPALRAAGGYRPA